MRSIETVTTRTRSVAGLVVMAFLLAACAGSDERTATIDTSTASGDVVAAIPVKLAAVADEAAAQPVTATGVVALRDEIALSFKVGGIVAQVLAREGQAVRAGDLLAVLDLREIDAQVAKARSSASKADRDLARIQRLHADSVATRQQLDDATTAAEVARADLETAAVNRQYARIIAPSDGVILQRSAEPGELVSTGAAVLTLGSLTSGTVVRVSLSDRDIVRVELGDKATLRADALGDRESRGMVRQIAASADPRTGTFLVEIALDTGSGLVPGMIGRVAIDAGGAERLRTVPVEALLEADGDRATVFALAPDGRAKRVPVEIAFVRGEHAAVRRGLGGVSRVVTDGAAYLSDGSTVRIVP